MSLKARNDIHLARRAWHFFGVMFILFLYTIVPEEHRILAIATLCGGPIALDVARQFLPALNSSLMRLFKPFMRESERHEIAGMSYLLIGSSIVMIFFPTPVVRLSLLMFSLADPLASYFGIKYGKEKLIGNKTIQGCGAAFVACFLVSGAYFHIMNNMVERIFIATLLSAIIGAASELVPVGKMDDNLVFPVVSSILLYGIFYLFGGL